MCVHIYPACVCRVVLGLGGRGDGPAARPRCLSSVRVRAEGVGVHTHTRGGADGVKEIWVCENNR